MSYTHIAGVEMSAQEIWNCAKPEKKFSVDGVVELIEKSKINQGFFSGLSIISRFDEVESDDESEDENSDSENEDENEDEEKDNSDSEDEDENEDEEKDNSDSEDEAEIQDDGIEADSAFIVGIVINASARGKTCKDGEKQIASKKFWEQINKKEISVPQKQTTFYCMEN